MSRPSLDRRARKLWECAWVESWLNISAPAQLGTVNVCGRNVPFLYSRTKLRRYFVWAVNVSFLRLRTMVVANFPRKSCTSLWELSVICSQFRTGDSERRFPRGHRVCPIPLGCFSLSTSAPRLNWSIAARKASPSTFHRDNWLIQSGAQSKTMTWRATYGGMRWLHDSLAILGRKVWAWKKKSISKEWE